MKRIYVTAFLGLALLRTSAVEAHSGPVVNPASNPLLGTSVNNAGAYRCDTTRTFLAHTQTWVVDGKAVTAPATYAVELPKVYVQEHPGSGGTVAYV